MKRPETIRMDPLRHANPPLLERKRLVGLSARARSVVSPSRQQDPDLERALSSTASLPEATSGPSRNGRLVGDVATPSVSLANTHRRAERIATLLHLRP
ncbi:MAG TPA: hypothetical protein VM848_09165 [Acidimicrobiia bacterium]|nr:hypothetical protein [Acidimicrobiia bacterium]